MLQKIQALKTSADPYKYGCMLREASNRIKMKEKFKLLPTFPLSVNLLSIRGQDNSSQFITCTCNCIGLYKSSL